MNKISLSKFDKGDVKFVLNNFAMFFKNPTAEQVEKRIEAWRDGFGFCINCDGQKVGLITLSEKQSKTLSFGIMILNQFRGKGIAKQAFDLAAAEAKSKGYTTIISSCAKTNQASIRMHQKIGFDLIKQEINAAGNEVCRWQKSI